MYYTYIVYSKTIKKYYTGQSNDLKKRINEHNRDKSPFMASGLLWDLVFFKEFVTRKEAVKLEKYIKSRGAERYLNNLKNLEG